MVKIEINGERWYTVKQMKLLLGRKHAMEIKRFYSKGFLERKEVDGHIFYRFSETYIDDNVLDKCERKDWNTLKA